MTHCPCCGRRVQVHITDNRPWILCPFCGTYCNDPEGE